MDDASPVMQLLRARVPLTLLLDLAWAPSASTLMSREQVDLARLRPREETVLRGGAPA